MANIITVLVEHDNINYYKDKLNEINREVVLKALGEDIVDMYTQYENDVYNVQPNILELKWLSQRSKEVTLHQKVENWKMFH